MKKKIAFLLAIAMLTTGLAACGSEKKENSNLNSNVSSSAGDVSSDASSSSSTPDKSEGATSSTTTTDENIIANTPTQPTDVAQPEQTQPTTQTPESKPQETPVTPPANNNNNTQAKPEQPSNPTPQPTPTPEVPAKSPAVSDIAAAIDKALGVDSNFMTFTADDVSLNYGIGSSSMTEFVGKMPMMSVKATEYLVVKAADGQVDTVKNGMLKRQADLDAQWKQYLPEQYELVKNYKLVANGNYVLFVIGENASGAVDAFNSMTK